MEIITVTCLRTHNYGAVLQAYALHKTLLSLGYENKLLDYTIEAKGKTKKTIKAICRDLLLWGTRTINIKKYRRFSEGFSTFVNRNIRLTRNYKSLADLYEDPPKCDCYLTGSDQVFALGNQLTSVRFLDFYNAEIPRVSYAASLGSYDMTEEELSYIRARLNPFQAISLREKKGCEYLSKTLGLSCLCHIDPVFLLPKEQWDSLSRERSRINEKYILVYPMIGNRRLQETIDALKKDLDLPVISVQNKFVKTVKADQYLYDVTVPEFLSLIKNAAAVVTTSFHATCFSIIFKRPFFSLVGDYKPERAKNICELLGLEDRVVSYDFAELPTMKCDFSGIDEIIKKERERAVEYLLSLKKMVETS